MATACHRQLVVQAAPRGIVGVIGPNGAGKTTLFKMLTARNSRQGHDQARPLVKLSYVDQSRDHLDDAKTVWEEISGGLDIMKYGDKREMPSRAYCGWFNFKGPDQQKKVGLLSGGERNRVHLAKMLKEGGNLLLLDEPTNDLDTETLGALGRVGAGKISPAAPWLSPMIASSSTALPPTSWPSKATATWNGSKATSKPTRKTKSAASATPPSSPPYQVQALSSGDWNAEPVAAVSRRATARPEEYSLNRFYEPFDDVQHDAGSFLMRGDGASILFQQQTSLQAHAHNAMLCVSCPANFPRSMRCARSKPQPASKALTLAAGELNVAQAAISRHVARSRDVARREAVPSQPAAA